MNDKVIYVPVAVSEKPTEEKWYIVEIGGEWAEALWSKGEWCPPGKHYSNLVETWLKPISVEEYDKVLRERIGEMTDALDRIYHLQKDEEYINMTGHDMLVKIHWMVSRTLNKPE